MGIRKSTERYESWLASQVAIVAADLELKHERMREAVFPFMRATFYRWAEIIGTACADELGAARVAAVGDLHLENFGTWRDAEGRLAWGINDFDEAATMPAAGDLIRVATSARLAAHEKRVALDAKDAADALLDGYRAALEAGGRAYVLAEEHQKLRHMAADAQRCPIAFWEKIDKLPLASGVPDAALAALTGSLPARSGAPRICARTAGLGSLGRPRFVAIADLCGGKIARETKPLLPSAAVWAGLSEPGPHAIETLLERAVRCPDPTVHVAGGWLVRRLAPDCTKIDIGQLPREREETTLLRAMGFETANVHLATGSAAALAEEHACRPKGWLARAAERMANLVVEDWEAFRKG